MAVPSYTEDLTDIDLAESGSTGVAVNVSGGGGASPAFGADLGMQGAGCWDRQVSTHERGIVFNQTPGTGTVAAGVHLFHWGFVATPGITDTLATRGAYVLIGTSSTDLVQFHVEGNDTYGAQGRVGKCYVIDYVSTANTGSVPYRTLYGTPGATPTYFGFGMKTTAAAKGSNLGVDAIRYGTGAYITAGELISEGDASDNPCTFAGFNTQNDNNTNRWGILTSTGGTNYELQGTFAIGQNNAGTATLCRFVDSDRNISLVDTVHSETTFTNFIIDHASTRCDWTNISITALGTNNPGQINVTTANPVFNVTGGSWTDIGVTVLRSNTTVDGTTWRTSDSITTNGATISNFTVDKSTAAASMIVGTFAGVTAISGGIFASDGSNYAIQLTSGNLTGSFTWDNTTTGYDTGTAASPVTPTTTGNETIYITDTTGTVTINVAAGATIPSIRSGGATVNVVAGQRTFRVSKVPDLMEIRIYDNTTPASPTELGGVETVGATPTGLNNVTVDADPNNSGFYRVTYTYTYASDINIRVVGIQTAYLPIDEETVLADADATFQLAPVNDRVFSNP
jgi:hypothetical protein